MGDVDDERQLRNDAKKRMHASERPAHCGRMDVNDEYGETTGRRYRGMSRWIDVPIPAQAQRTRTQGANTRNACTHRALFRTSQAQQHKRDGCGLRARSHRASRRVRGRRMGACIAGPHWASAHRACPQARMAASCGRSHQAGRSGQWRCTHTSRTQHGDAC